jgi:hypothetical protein
MLPWLAAAVLVLAAVLLGRRALKARMAALAESRARAAGAAESEQLQKNPKQFTKEECVLTPSMLIAPASRPETTARHG